MAPLARPGIWSGVSGLIGYRGRLWFVNSEKFVNHNSADLYTYDPATGRVRYERHLFSQDAGDPVAAFGLLYWPFEDPRFSAGRGEFMVTNGSEWDWRVLPEGRAFHIHAMIARRGLLYAASSAWRAGIQVSRDRGATWRVIYDHKTPKGFVSRITSLAVLKGTLYAGITAHYREAASLLRMDGDEGKETFSPLPGWPKGVSAGTLRAYRGWLYAVNRSKEGEAVWRTDGRRVERVRGLDGRRVRDFEAGERTLWAVSAKDGKGALLRSADGLRWTVAHTFKGEEPLDVALFGGRVYAGTLGPKGAGGLWGPPARAAAPIPAGERAPLPKRPPPLAGEALAKALVRLDRALALPSTYRPRRGGLLRALAPFARAGGREAGIALSRRLSAPAPDLAFTIFGGRIPVTAAGLARWHLLRAIALAGAGRVPPAYLALPWEAPANGAEKYFHPAPGAAWAAARLGQAGPETLAALIARLGMKGDPRWLAGDIVGALTVLTGRRFGHDYAAWRAWHAKRAPGARP